MKKKLIALLAAVAMVFSLAACGSTPDSVGTIGTVDITSGLYLLAQYDAYQKAADLATSEQDATDVKAFLKQTITVDADSGETATVSDYVYDLGICQTILEHKIIYFENPQCFGTGGFGVSHRTFLFLLRQFLHNLRESHKM